MSGEPVIVGVAESSLGITNKTRMALHAEAAASALAESGLALRDVDALYTTEVSRFPATSVAEYLGLTPTWIEATMAGGASYEIFVAYAAEALRAGRCEVALITYGNNQRSAKSRQLGGVVDEHTPVPQFEQPYGPLSPISLYAMAAQRHMHEFGTTSEQLAEVAVAARAWALRNPKAFRYGEAPLTVLSKTEPDEALKAKPAIDIGPGDYARLRQAQAQFALPAPPPAPKPVPPVEPDVVPATARGAPPALPAAVAVFVLAGLWLLRRRLGRLARPEG